MGVYPKGPCYFAPLVACSSYRKTRIHGAVVVEGLGLVKSEIVTGSYERIGHFQTMILPDRYEDCLERVDKEAVEFTVV
jgi:hypothetical protein